MRYLLPSVCLLFAALFPVVTFAERLAIPLTEQANIKTNEAGAQTLYSVKQINVDAHYNWQSTEYYSIRINDLEAARDYGRITISYNHYYSDLELAFANVLTPNGEIKSVKADAMQNRTAGSQDFYEDRTMLVFSLPEIVPGSIMEFQYRRKSIHLPMPGLFSASSSAYWYQPKVGGNGGRIDPVYNAIFKITAPKQLSLKAKPVGPSKPHYHKKTRGDKTHYQWQWQNLKDVALEAAMPPVDQVMSRVRVSSSDEWASVDQWTWNLTKNKFAADQSVKTVARTLVALSATREEKIKAVYAYTQENVRYVFAHLGRGGYEPHFASEVIQQRYGDCKDQTILAIALLKELGIDAYPSLVVTSRNGKPNMDLVALYFDHMVVWVPGETPEQGIWMDTTADRALFPGMSNYLLGQSALIVDGNGGRLTTIDQQLPDNIGTLTMDYYVDKNDHLIVDVITEPSGVYEQNLRSWWIHDSNRETSLQQMMGAIFPDAKGNVDIDAKVINKDDLWQPFTIQTRFDFGLAHPEENTPMALGVGLLQAFRVFGDIGSMQIPKGRKNRWINNQSEVIRVNARMSGAAGDLPAVVSSGVDLSNPFFTVTQSGQQNGNYYQVNIEMTRHALDLNTEEYEQYYKALNGLSNAGHWLVSFLADEKQVQLTKVTSQASTTDLRSQLTLARYYLDQGQFEKALEPANAAVNLDNASGEAWYLLGVVQGYNAMVDESMDSFAHASSLGYTP